MPHIDLFRFYFGLEPVLEPRKADQPVSVTPRSSVQLQGLVGNGLLCPPLMTVVSAQNTSTESTGRITQKMLCK